MLAISRGSTDTAREELQSRHEFPWKSFRRWRAYMLNLVKKFGVYRLQQARKSR